MGLELQRWYDVVHCTLSHSACSFVCFKAYQRAVEKISLNSVVFFFSATHLKGLIMINMYGVKRRQRDPEYVHFTWEKLNVSQKGYITYISLIKLPLHGKIVPRQINTQISFLQLPLNNTFNSNLPSSHILLTSKRIMDERENENQVGKL